MMYRKGIGGLHMSIILFLLVLLVLCAPLVGGTAAIYVVVVYLAITEAKESKKD
jgi:hypothetical protein